MLSFTRPTLEDKIYLREVPAVDEALQALAGEPGEPGEPGDLTLRELVPSLSKHFSMDYLFFSEQTPMLFAGDGGTGSHLHIDRKPLVQFCHVLHGTKVFCVAPAGASAPGPVVPWDRKDPTDPKGPSSPSYEATLSTDSELPAGAAEWLQREDVSVAVVQPGDVLLFLGQSLHAGCNGAGRLCMAVFHGAQPTSYMAQGVFGPAYQALARKVLAR